MDQRKDCGAPRGVVVRAVHRGDLAEDSADQQAASSAVNGRCDGVENVVGMHAEASQHP